MRRLHRGIAVCVASVLVIAGRSGDGDDDKTTTKPAKTVTDATTTTEETPPEPTPTAQQPIIITEPKQFSTVVDSFELAGQAKVFEGALMWAIDNADGVPYIQGSMTASCGAPCNGKFSTTVLLRKVPVGSWELHVWSPPVDDSDSKRAHDTFIPITVANERIEDAPPPDAAPPGGAPQLNN